MAPSDGARPVRTEDVSLTVPARGEYLRLARLAGSGLASRLGFSWEEVEDLRLAIDELCYALVGPEDGDGRLRIVFRISEPLSLEVRGWREPASAEAPALSELSRRILDALVDDHGHSEDNGHHRSLWLRKQRAGASA
jgi:hypothetical protein